MKDYKLALFSVLAMIVAVFVTGDVSAEPLQLCIDWFDGFTGHLDGVAAVATGGAVVASTTQAAAEPEEQRAPQVDISALNDAITQLVDQRMTEAAQATPAPEINATTTDVVVKADRSLDSDTAVLGQTYKMMQRLTVGDFAGVRDIQDKLLAAGKYGERATQSGLTDGAGAVFLPTVILNTVERLAGVYGVGRQVATRHNIPSGSMTIPNVSAGLAAFAVGEGGELKARTVTFADVTLDPDSWGVISPFTTEIEMEAGAGFMQSIAEEVGQAFAKIEDQALFIGDGTATYNSISGVTTVGGTGTYTLGSGDTAFTAFDATDAIDAIVQVAVGARAGSAFFFHPDFVTVLRKMKDNAGAYIYAYDDTGRPRLAGLPVYYTEALPALSATAANTTFGIVGNPRYLHMGEMGSLGVTRLTEATIKDTDDTTEIHLALTNRQALRFIEYFDAKVSRASAFALIKTAAS